MCCNHFKCGGHTWFEACHWELLDAELGHLLATKRTDIEKCDLDVGFSSSNLALCFSVLYHKGSLEPRISGVLHMVSEALQVSLPPKSEMFLCYYIYCISYINSWWVLTFMVKFNTLSVHQSSWVFTDSFNLVQSIMGPTHKHTLDLVLSCFSCLLHIDQWYVFLITGLLYLMSFYRVKPWNPICCSIEFLLY